MTRDEAIEKFGSVGGSSFASSAWIDRFVAIGILKLDEPKSIRDRLDDAYKGYVSLTPSGLLEQLERVGLKLVTANDTGK